MAKQKSKAGAEKKQTSRLWLPIGIVAVVALAGGLIWLAAQWTRRAHAQVLHTVSGYGENLLSGAKIRVTAAPEWVQENLVDDLLAQLQSSNVRRSLLDPGLARTIAETFCANPWVESARVEKRFGEVIVDVSYRKPVLSVPYGPYNCYVDAHGVALPPPTPSEPPQQFRNCLWIEHFPPTTIPSVGERFEDERLCLVAKLAESLIPHKSKLNVVAIVVTSGGEEELACYLQTRLGSRILLGSVQKDVSEESLAKTFAPLQAWLDRYGSLDAPEGPYQFDLRDEVFADPIPLVALRR